MSQLSAATLSRLNAQYAHETRNKLIYEASASVADFFGLTGSAKFLRAQAEGENGHAKIVYDFICLRNEQASAPSVSMTAIPQDFFAIFENARQVELDTTEKLKFIASEAFNEGDLQTFFWCKGLIDEQVEEENIIQTIIDRFTLCGRSPEMIHHYDVWVGELNA